MAQSTSAVWWCLVDGTLVWQTFIHSFTGQSLNTFCISSAILSVRTNNPFALTPFKPTLRMYLPDCNLGSENHSRSKAFLLQGYLSELFFWSRWFCLIPQGSDLWDNSTKTQTDFKMGFSHRTFITIFSKTYICRTIVILSEDLIFLLSLTWSFKMTIPDWPRLVYIVI